MKEKDLKIDMMMIIVLSFIGFCFEDVWMLIRYNLLDNRNMHLPFLVGYGLLMVGLYYFIGTPKKILNKYELKKPINYIIYVLLSFVIVSIVEIVLGTVVEKIYNFSFWNYTKLPLHITKYTSLFTSIGFSIAITLFMTYLYIPIKNKIIKVSKKIPLILVIIIIIVLSLDCFISFNIMSNNKGRNIIWVIKFK